MEGLVCHSRAWPPCEESRINREDDQPLRRKAPSLRIPSRRDVTRWPADRAYVLGSMVLDNPGIAASGW